MTEPAGNLPDRDAASPHLGRHRVADRIRRYVLGQAGAVASVSIISDKFSGQSRGFGFVEMDSQSEAQAAIERFNGSDFQGRALTVNEARPRPERSGGGRSSSGGYGGREHSSSGGYGGGTWNKRSKDFDRR
jgi:RNA recognition motif-containing protein